jgi:hypothetical protein
MGLLLEAVDVTGPLRWRWLLSDEETGNPVADHDVALDPSSNEVVRFRDLGGHVRSYAAPDRLTEDGARFVREAGEWAGRELLGESVGAAILAEAPVAAVLRRILDGERGDSLLEGLHPIHAAIARETLVRLNRER